MTTFVTHPDNVEWLKSHLERAADSGIQPVMGFHLSPLWAIEIKSSPYCERYRPTGKLIGPDGIARDREGFRCPWDDFTDLEESDLAWAIPLGLVVEEQERAFYKASPFRAFMDFGPRILGPRSILVNSAF